MAVKETKFGVMPDGRSVALYALSAGPFTAKVTPFGGIWTEMHAPDRHGKLANVVLGFDRLEPYLGKHPYFGATTGRVANRINKATFQLHGKTHKLPTNDGEHCLHGGISGLSHKLWNASASEGAEGPSVTLTYTSPDGEEGFPGNLAIKTVYTLSAKGAMRIEFTATTDKPTPVNLCNHAYFNLGGVGSGDVLKTVLTIHGDRYTPVDEKLIPTGELKPVAGTPVDFLHPHAIGERIGQTTGGYDHNFALQRTGDLSAPAATAIDPGSGRTLTVYTTQPGIQLYTGNFLDGSNVGNGGTYNKHAGFCLETQHFPDSVNQPNFPDTILRPGQTYKQTAIYAFSA